jgi:hypothetical protein
MGATFVILFIWAKFWHIRHFGSPLAILSLGVGDVLGDKLKHGSWP